MIKKSNINKNYKKNYSRMILLSILFYSLNIKNAFAYLDPGTGSIILQAIIAVIATTSATLAYYWRKIKIVFKKLFEKKKNLPEE